MLNLRDKYRKTISLGFIRHESCTSVSMWEIRMLNEFHFLPSITYIFNDDSSETFLTLDFLKKINKNLMFKFGFKLYDLDKYETLPFMSIKYKI